MCRRKRLLSLKSLRQFMDLFETLRIRSVVGDVVVVDDVVAVSVW